MDRRDYAAHAIQIPRIYRYRQFYQFDNKNSRRIYLDKLEEKSPNLNLKNII